MVASDIEIARAARLKPMAEIGARLDIPADAILPYGRGKAKLSEDFLAGIEGRQDGKLVLVTAMTPTPAGEGKTTTTVGLSDGLNRIGKKAISCTREPSAGPRRRGTRSRRTARPGTPPSHAPSFAATSRVHTASHQYRSSPTPPPLAARHQ